MLVVLMGTKRKVFTWAILFGGHHLQIIALPEMTLFMVKGDGRLWGLMLWDEKAFPWGHACFPTVGLFLCSLDYALRFSRFSWKQESVVPVLESPVGLSCFLKFGS